MNVGVRRSTVDHSGLLKSPDDPEFRNAKLERQRKLSNEEAARKAAEYSRSKDAVTGRVTSQMWELESFDPFQIFEVTQKKCQILNVKVVSGTNITKGWLNDLVDTPDPYLVISVPGTPNGKKRTRTIDNCTNPTWDENFQFYMDPSDVLQLELVLMDANYTLDEEMGKCILDLDDVLLNTEVVKHATFENGSKIQVKLNISEEENPDLRYSLALSEEEKTYLRERRERVMWSITKLLGEEESPKSPKEVPVIGLLGSGGGFRAMTALSGVCHALQDEGVMDCLMYMAGLSGSTWYLSFLYSHPDFPSRTPGELKAELRDAVAKNWVKLLTPVGVARYSKAIYTKMNGGQPVSFTDLFGHLVGDTLLGPERKLTTLTDQRKCLERGAAPLPLYTCLNVKKNVSARVFQDWFEFSPFEVGVAKYGSFMRPEYFGSKFYVGKMIKQFPEPPLHFLQGIWGSAFCILFKRLMKDGAENKNKDLAEMIRDGEEDEGAEIESFDQLGDFVVTGDEDVGDSSGDEMEEHSSDESSASSRRASIHVDAATISREARDTPTKSSNKKVKHKLQRCNAIKRDVNDSEDERPTTTNVRKGLGAWKERCRTQRKVKEEKQKGFWQKALDSLFSSSVLDTRAGRAGLVFNPLRGLNMKTTFPVSPFSPTTAEDDVDFKGFYESTELRAKKLYLVDSGLTFNIPFPLLLRPQRAVDLYLSFDFSGRTSDESSPFKEILLAEQWARLNHVPFPHVKAQVAKYDEEPIKEWYLFEDPEDPHCPVILHFIILNKQFKEFKAPNVRRTSKEEKDFANFSIFSDPDTPYSIYNFCYTNQQFERMSQLMEFNVRLGIDEIKQQIKNAIKRKRVLRPEVLPCPLSRVTSLKGVTRDKRKLARFNTMVRMSMKSASHVDKSDNDDDEEFQQAENSDDEFEDAQNV